MSIFESTKLDIVKLNNHNYLTWKYRMELVFIAEYLWDIVTGEQPKEDDDKHWQTEDEKAREIIAQSIDDDQTTHIHDKTTAAEMWQALKGIHDNGNFLAKIDVFKEISGFRMQKDQTMDEHICKHSNMFLKLIDMGDKHLSEQWKVNFLLSSLPGNYENIVSGIGKIPGRDLTWSLVCAKLLEEQEPQKNHTQTSFDYGLSNSLSLVIQSSNPLENYGTMENKSLEYYNTNWHF